MSASSITVLEVATIHLSPIENGRSNEPLNTTSEKERATNRFFSAQKLFRQQTAPLPSAVTITRQRNNTESSLYTKLDQSVTDSNPSTDRQRAVSSPENTSFTDAFMNPASHKLPNPAAVTALASSLRPPTPVNQGCLLLGPRRSLLGLDVTRSIKATTTNGGSVWYCRRDKLVIFDGVRETNDNGSCQLITRSSRGLDISRKNCAKEKIRIELPCSHCQDLLKRKTWVFEERVLECRLCKNCQDRCWKEWETRQSSSTKPRPTQTQPILAVIQPTTPLAPTALTLSVIQPITPPAITLPTPALAPPTLTALKATPPTQVLTPTPSTLEAPPTSPIATRETPAVRPPTPAAIEPPIARSVATPTAQVSETAVVEGFLGADGSRDVKEGELKGREGGSTCLRLAAPPPLNVVLVADGSETMKVDFGEVGMSDAKAEKGPSRDGGWFQKLRFGTS